jgi:hypothetical protein
MIRRRRRLLDDHGVDPEAIEQEAHRKPHRATADDEDRCAARCILGDGHAYFLQSLIFIKDCALFDISQEYV